MADYAALAAELQDPGYAGLDDAAAADRLNAPVPGPLAPISPAQVLRWLATGGRYERLQQAQSFTGPDAATTAGVRSLARAMMRIFDLGQALDLADPEIAGMAAAFVAVGVFTEADLADLKARGATTTTRAIQAFGVPVTAHDVAHARSL